MDKDSFHVVTCLRLLVHTLICNTYGGIGGGLYTEEGLTVEQIINKLREVEVMSAKGEPMDSAIRKIGVTRNIYCRRREEDGGEPRNEYA